MKLSLAIACLLAPQGQAVSIKNKLMGQSQFPTLPSAQSIVNVVQGGLDIIAKELPREMHSMESYYNGEEQVTYERGLRRDIGRANRDAVEGFEHIGIDMSKNVYDPKFITDLIEAEYSDFVKQFKAHAAEVVPTIQERLDIVAQKAADMGLAETNAKTTQPQIAGWTDCDAQRYGNCQQQGECPGPCCWRGPENDAEQAAFQKYDDDMSAQAEQCYLNSPFVRDVFSGEAPPQVTEDLAKGLIGAVKEEAGRARNADELEGVISGINAILSGEAKRLGVEAPALPDPKDTASKIMQGLSKAVDAAENNIDDVVRELKNIRAEMIREVWKVERTIVYTLGFSPFNQGAALAKLNELKTGVASGDAERDFKRAAKDINDLGGNTNTDEVTKFVADTLDTLIKVASDPNFENQEAEAIQNAEHQAEEMAARSIKM